VRGFGGRVPRWFSCSSSTETAIGGRVFCDASRDVQDVALPGHKQRCRRPHCFLLAAVWPRGDAPHFESLGEAFSPLKLALPPVNLLAAVWPRGKQPSF